jgi:ADP-ribosylglycohydrolase
VALRLSKTPPSARLGHLSWCQDDDEQLDRRGVRMTGPYPGPQRRRLSIFGAPGAPGRALGALYGLAVGDALGMPTQTLSRDAVRELFGDVTWFHDGPGVNPVSRGLPAGSVTDDTDQALIVARALLDGDGHVSGEDLAGRLLAWQAAMVAKGSADLLGPSTARALEAVGRGVPVDEAGRHGDTNGAAMRVAAVGVAVPPEPLERLVDRVVEVSRVTHHTRAAIAGASAVAAAVSLGVLGARAADQLDVAVEAAELGARHGHDTGVPDVASRIRRAVELARGAAGEAAALDAIAEHVGTGVATHESVPAAFALVARYPDDPWRAVRRAAGLGDDSDTIAAMAGAVCGSRTGLSAFPPEAVALVRKVNNLTLEPLADALLRLRTADANSA